MPSLTNRNNQPLDLDKTGEPDAQRVAEWRRWALSLRRLGLAKFAAAFLDSGGAFSTLAAQALYVSQPLFDPWTSRKSVSHLANLLENPIEAAAFSKILREEIQ